MQQTPPDTRPEYGVGFLGFGFMGKAHTYGHKTLSLYYKDLPFRTRLEAVCTGHETTARQAAQQGFAWYTTDPEDIVTHPDIDIVHICTPNRQHAQWAIKALENGKAVYCEKPMAANEAEAHEMWETAQRTGGRLQVVFHNRFFPSTLRARELVEQGFLGDICAFRGAYLHAGNMDASRAHSWRFDIAQSGGGALYDLGSHLIDLFLWLCPAEPESVLARTNILHTQRQGLTVTADDHAALLLTLKNGVTGTLEATKLASGIQDELRLELHGTKGALRLNLMDANWLDIYDATQPEMAYGGMRGWQRIESVGRYEAPAAFPAVKSTPGWLRAHVHSLYTFLDGLYRNEKRQPDGETGWRVQHLMDTAYQSAANNEWQKL